MDRGRDARPALLLALVLAAAFTLRLAIALRAPLFVTGDSEGYLVPAYALAHGGELELGIKRTPAYPAFVALSLMLQGDDLQSLALLQHLLGLVTVAASFWLGRSLGGTLIGIITGLCVGGLGTQLIAEHSLMTEALFIPTVTAALACGVWAVRSGSFLACAFAGGLLGLAILVRPVALILVPLFALGPVVEGGLRRRSLAAGAISILLAGLVFGVWTLRPGRSDDAAVGGLGQTLIGRTARHDRGGFTYWDPAFHSAESVQRQQVRQMLQDAVDRGSSGRAVHTRIRKETGLTSSEADAMMRDLALDTIRDQFGYYAQGTWLRFVRLAQPVTERLRDARNTHDVARQRWEDETTRPLLVQDTTTFDREAAAGEWLTGFQLGRVGPVAPLLAIFGAVTIALRGERGAAFLLGGSVLALLAVSAALVGNVPRYRYPVDAPMVTLGLAGLAAVGSTMFSALKKSSRPRINVQPTSSPAAAPSPPGRGLG
jgi:4-amino-4-deoxy-L-arabinose transferase-like glycosyltransferase